MSSSAALMREMELGLLGPQSPPPIPGAAGAEAPVSGSHLWDRQPRGQEGEWNRNGG